MFKTSSNVCLDHSCPYSQTSCVHVVFLITRPDTKQAYVLTITLRHRQTWGGGGGGMFVCKATNFMNIAVSRGTVSGVLQLLSHLEYPLK